MPVRKIPKSYIGVTGVMGTNQSIGNAEFESLLERDYLILLEFDPNVKTFEVQPVKIPVPGVPNGYHPDVLVEFHPSNDGTQNPSELTEVKLLSDFQENAEQYAPKFACAEKYAAERNWVFVKKDESQIRTPKLQNLKFLRGFRRIQPEESLKIHLCDSIEKKGPCTIAELIEICMPSDESKQQLLPVLWNLILNKQIIADLDLPLVSDSEIWSEHLFEQ
jgi:hypothetical protein